MNIPATKNLADTELRIIQKIKDLIFDEVLAYSRILSISIELGNPIAEIVLQEREKLENLLQKGR